MKARILAVIAGLTLGFSLLGPVAAFADGGGLHPDHHRDNHRAVRAVVVIHPVDHHHGR